VTRKTRSTVDDLRGAGRLAVEATRSVTDLVEAMHQAIGGGPGLLGRPLLGPTRFFTGPIYAGIRGVTGLVGAGIDGALARLAPLLGEHAPGQDRQALLAALNGVLGDYLADSDNPLAIQMSFRHQGQPLELEAPPLRLALPGAGGKLLVLVHGSCLDDLQWNHRGHDHGAALAEALGFTPVYLHYNSGLHVSTNGQALAGLLERLVAAWPAPVEALVILGHSMGGLVARSACHRGETAGHAWRRKLRALACLASPHHGAPLERGGHWIDLLLGVSRYSAPLARLGMIRSAGVTDLRYGNVLDQDWEGRDRFAGAGDVRRRLELPADVACFAIAATRSSNQASAPYASDGLVPVDSALGRHRDPGLALRFPEANQWIGFDMGHLDLLGRPEVSSTLRAWLSS
jgi:hypothetical protein